MLKNLRIGPRMLVLLAVQALLMLAIGAIALFGLRATLTDTQGLAAQIEQGSQLTNVRSIVSDQAVRTISAVDAGAITWREASARLEGIEGRFSDALDGYTDSLDEAGQLLFDNTLSLYVFDVRAGLSEAVRLVVEEDRGQVELFVLNDTADLFDPFLDATEATSLQQERISTAVVTAAVEQERQFQTLTLVAALAGLVLALLLGIAVYRSIASPVRAIEATVQEVNAGELGARVDIEGRDELKQLGDSFNQLLDERVTQLQSAQNENETLNDSVINLLRAVAQLANKDLRVRVPVTEDITGPVADALNLMTDETAEVLGTVRSTAHHVANASREVKGQADKAMALSRDERAKIRQTSKELTVSSKSMLEVATLASQCNSAAEGAMLATESAQSTVQGTVAGINSIRDVIRETEKRIKRLGERSQEISGAVNLINNIAERTHILALNASMHAASAGEAGRGFAVVADEVQRLAENAREATREISSLVDNIQVETADTSATMNDVIAQVVKGTELAGVAGSQMQTTRDQTGELVELVKRISTQARAQAEVSKLLVKRALEVARSTEETHRELTEQTANTELLADFSENLVQSVSVFKLPNDSDETDEPGRGGVTVVDFPLDDAAVATVAGH